MQLRAATTPADANFVRVIRKRFVNQGCHKRFYNRHMFFRIIWYDISTFWDRLVRYYWYCIRYRTPMSDIRKLGVMKIRVSRWCTCSVVQDKSSLHPRQNCMFDCPNSNNEMQSAYWLGLCAWNVSTFSILIAAASCWAINPGFLVFVAAMGYPSGKGKAGMGDLALKFRIITIAYNCIQWLQGLHTVY